ncbi:hypothetical protein BH10PLA1_BH10PLA1_02380 [soil metagenome]
MLFGKSKSRLTPDQALAAKPVRLVEADMQPDERGGRLKVPLHTRKFAGWLFKMPNGATKTFEFDAIGVYVWEQIDGRTTVQQLIRKLAKKYSLSEREAAVSTNLFLKMLGKKSLIGWNVPEKKGAS